MRTDNISLREFQEEIQAYSHLPRGTRRYGPNRYSLNRLKKADLALFHRIRQIDAELAQF